MLFYANLDFVLVVIPSYWKLCAESTVSISSYLQIVPAYIKNTLIALISN